VCACVVCVCLQEIYPPPVKEFATASAGAYSVADIKNMEATMIKVWHGQTKFHCVQLYAVCCSLSTWHPSCVMPDHRPSVGS